ncbi:MAG: AAA family ATPase [Chitinivibrionales bacterium]|nr:AAA family ATPase [Chitinivibrionales bacterium]MBD3396184.1 AAA family ATPase [Chitinivibrionales bacterium]
MWKDGGEHTNNPQSIRTGNKESDSGISCRKAIARTRMNHIPNEAISASAGTGKTYRLAARYIRLLAAGARPESIVALTFSRKAAGEIFDRIIGLVTDWIAAPEKQRADGAALGIPPLARDGLVTLLRTFLGSLHMIPVGTIDSFLVRIIRTFPFEFGLTGEFEILDDLALQQAKQQVFRHILWEETSRAGTRGFLEQFKRATFGREEKKLHRLLGDFVDDNHECYLATLDSGHWGDRDTIWPAGNKLFALNVEPSAETARLRDALLRHDSLGKRNKWEAFLREAEAFAPSSVLTESESFFEKNLLPSLAGLEQGVCDIKGYNKGRNALRFDHDECRALARLIHHVVACHIQNALVRSRGMHDILSHYERAYEHLFRRNGKLTFNDILYLLSPAGYRDTALVLSNNVSDEDKLYIDYRLDSRYDHWLLDEFQDTSRAQWMVLRNLVDEVMQDDTGEKTFFYVGDVKQAIYAWRGGDASLFGSVHADLKTRYDAFELTTLSSSWRSGPEVIETVERVFSAVGAGRIAGVRPELAKVWQWPPHDTHRRDIAGHAALFEIPRERGEGKSDVLARKARVIAGTVKEAQPIERGMSVAVLTRTNKAAQALSQLLESHGIRTALEGAVSLCDSDVVKGILSLVKFAAHPGDTLAREHARMTPLAAVIPDTAGACTRILHDIHDRGFARCVRAWTDQLGTRPGAGFNAFTRQRIGELERVSQAFDATGSKNCLDYIDFVRRYRIPATSIGGVVQVLTIHKAKGLEYDVVFLPDLDGHRSITRARTEGIQIKRNASGNPEWAMALPRRAVAEQDPVLREFLSELDAAAFYEELCVLYVGMTRAARSLYLIAEEKGKSAQALHLADIARDALRENGAGAPARGSADAACLYSRGDPRWYAGCKKAAARGAGTRTMPKLHIDFGNVLAAATPSRMEHRSVELGDVLSGRIDRSLDLGTAVHSIFEQCEDAFAREPEELAREWRESAPFGKETADQAVSLFCTAVRKTEIRKVLSRPDTRCDIWIERPFDVVLDGRWVSGVFDRVTIRRDLTGKAVEAAVLDYKTDRAETDADIETIVDTYRPQLDLYQRVLEVLCGLPRNKIRKQILLVRAARVVTVGN